MYILWWRRCSMLKKIVFFLILSVASFAFKIDSLDFDKTIAIDEKATQVYTLTNNKNYPLRYQLSIEESDKNISVTPKTLLIPAHSEKKFSVAVTGASKGEKHYFLILEEEGVNLENKGSYAKLKMKYRIEHKYWVK